MKKKGVERGVAVLFTLLVLSILLLAGPAKAFSIALTMDDTELDIGEVISFMGDVNIEAVENLQVDNLELRLEGPEIISCLFLADGTITSGCKGITIEYLGNASQEYGYGYADYGYGYKNGYGYGYTNGKLIYNFTLNSTDYSEGNYSTQLKVFINGKEFSNNGEVIHISEPTVPPPYLIVYQPNITLSDSKRVYFNLTTIEEVDEIKYINWNDRNPRLKRLCRRCGEYGYLKKKMKTLKEGENNLSFRAIKDDEVYEVNWSVFIDSKKPRISRRLPRRNSVVNGSWFYIKYTEYNLQNITLHLNESEVVMNCTSGKNKNCSASANISIYDGQEIEYWFEVSDIVRTVESRKTKIKVDTSSPELTVNFPQNETYGRRVPFNITVTEEVKLEYYDYNKERWKNLGSRTDDYGYSRKKTKTFKRGLHKILIRATDKAGNSDTEEAEFNVIY